MSVSFNWSCYTGNLKWLPVRTIYLVRHGSHAYGTNIEGSDEDFRGIAVAPSAYYLGALSHFEQAEQKEPDFVVFDLRKFVQLASQCNPNIIEVLFVDDADVLHADSFGWRLRQERELFLTRRARHTFSGYAASQLKRIRTHHRWLKNPPISPPTRAEHGLPEKTLIPADHLAAAEAAIRAQLDEWAPRFLDELDPGARTAVSNRMAEHLATLDVAMHEDLWPGAARVVGLSDNMIELLAREKRYTSAKREWDNYQTWKRQRNPVRAALEQRFGYDTKHAGHLVRLLRMCREILETGRVLVKRPDADELRAIRGGAWTYEKLVEWAENEDRELQAVAERSRLPTAPDPERIDLLCSSIIARALEYFDGD